VKVAYCPTRDMLGDFFTKPLHGSIFMDMHDKILKLPSSKGAAAHRSVLRNDKNISTSVARNVKWARGTAAHARQPDNKGENSATQQGENSAT